MSSMPGLACAHCGRRHVPPAYVCQACHGTQLEPVELSGLGRIYSFTTIHVAPEGFAGEAPYHVAVIDLDDGVRATARIERAAGRSIEIGSRVEFSQSDDHGFLFRLVE